MVVSQVVGRIVAVLVFIAVGAVLFKTFFVIEKSKFLQLLLYKNQCRKNRIIYFCCYILFKGNILKLKTLEMDVLSIYISIYLGNPINILTVDELDDEIVSKLVME